MLRCGSPDTAADVVQEVFMGLLTDACASTRCAAAAELPVRRGAQPDPEARAGARPHGQPAGRDGDDGDDEAPRRRAPANRWPACSATKLAEDVRRALALLAPHYRDAVILYEMHDLSYQEIAAICQVDIGTVRSRLSRGRAALAKRLGAHRPQHD